MERRGRRQPPAIGSRPWILYFTGQGETFCSIPSSPSEPRQIYHHKRIPELRNTVIYGCCDGWLILAEDLGSGQSLGFSLWSPSTSHSIPMPTLNLGPGDKMRCCVLTSSPPPPPPPPPYDDVDDDVDCGCDCGCDRCGGCVLMVFIEMSPVIYFCRLRGGDRNWRQHWYRQAIVNAVTDSDDYDSDFDLKDEKLHSLSLLRYPVACEGQVFAWFGGRCRLAIVSVVDNGNNLSVTAYPNNSLPYSQRHLNFVPSRPSLVEWLGQVFSVRVFFGGIDRKEVLFVDVHKLDLSNMKWERVWRVGDVAFLLCGAFSIAYPATAGAETSKTGSLRAGHVYIFLRNDKSVYDYNIEGGGSLLATLPCPDLPTPWAMPTWIVPHLRLNYVGGDLNHLGSIAYKHEEEIHVAEDKKVVTHVQGRCKANENGKGLLNLPVDVLYLIASHLVVFDYMNFQLACKKTRELAPPVRWTTVAVSLKTHSLSPWLIYPDKERGVFTLIDPMFSQRYFLTIPEELSDANICYSKDGWLLMRGANDEEIFFYNPFTKVTYRSPNVPSMSFPRDGCVCFSGKPGTPALVAVSIVSLLKIEACFKWADEESWKLHEFLECTDFWINHNKPVFYDSAYYCLSMKGSLGVLRVSKTSNCSWEVLDKPQKPCGSFCQNFLVECEGELLSVFVGKLGSWVRVFKLKHAEMQWEEVHNLGKHMLFLSRYSSFSAVAKVPSMENKIYFPRFYGETSLDVVFYSLSTGKFRSHCASHPILVDFYGTREQSNCAWIEPSWVVHD